MEREELEQEIRRYDTILRFVSDERTIAVVSERRDEARNRLRDIDLVESGQEYSSAVSH